MKKTNLTARFIFIFSLALLGLIVVFGPHHRPTRQDFTWSGVKQNLANNIRLGLDLRGGSHLVMQVQTEEYLANLASGNAATAKRAAEEGGFPVKGARSVSNGGNHQVVLELNDASNINNVRDEIENKVGLSSRAGWSSSVSSNAITWTLNSDAKRQLSEQAVEQSLKIIENRINAFGVSEPTLQRHGAAGSNQVLLQMPGLQDPERVKQALKSESRLDLVHVVSDPSPAPSRTYETEDQARLSLGIAPGQPLPQNRQILPYAEREEPTVAGQTTDPNQPKPKRYVVIENPPVVGGDDLRDAQAVQRGGVGDAYQISFYLKPLGAEKFGRWTAANINQYMGVVLNGEVKSIAFIKSQITDSGEISGNFTKASADDLALTLRSGALPAKITYQEERTVGPSLGADSIRAGVNASVAGLVLVIGFMLFYYRGSGINAVVALILNMILMLAALVLFKATLTLPGIAGLILSIGMAVDSNVLIFERIREELASGKVVASAIEQGFGRAFVTIIDTHVTTIVSSLFLFLFGTGPIRGFAVTLVIGLLINLFTAVFVSRTIFLWQLKRKGGRLEALSI